MVRHRGPDSFGLALAKSCTPFSSAECDLPLSLQGASTKQGMKFSLLMNNPAPGKVNGIKLMANGPGNVVLILHSAALQCETLLYSRAKV